MVSRSYCPDPQDEGSQIEDNDNYTAIIEAKLKMDGEMTSPGDSSLMEKLQSFGMTQDGDGTITISAAGSSKNYSRNSKYDANWVYTANGPTFHDALIGVVNTKYLSTCGATTAIHYHVPTHYVVGWFWFLAGNCPAASGTTIRSEKDADGHWKEPDSQPISLGDCSFALCASEELI